MRVSVIVASLVLELLIIQSASAQHPIEVQRLAANAQYFESLIVFEKIPHRRLSADARVAAAKSAWALGLTEKAVAEFEAALQDAQLTKLQRARIYFSRALIERQEQHLKVALLYVQRAVEQLEQPGPLRARANMLWAELLSETQAFATAEQRLSAALEEAKPEDLGEVHYRLAECQLKLSKLEQARKNFESIEIGHELIPQALRHLAQIALDSGNFQSAEFWLSKGRAEYPDSFLDSWVDYALVQVAIHLDDQARVRSVQQQAQQRYAPADFWLNLLNAASEGYFWNPQKVLAEVANGTGA